MNKLPTPEREMTQEEAELLIDLQHVETVLHGRGDRASVLLAAALSAYRHRLEKEGGFVRLQPDPALEWLKHIEIQQGKGWLKLIDTRVARKREGNTFTSTNSSASTPSV